MLLDKFNNQFDHFFDKKIFSDHMVKYGDCEDSHSLYIWPYVKKVYNENYG